MNDRKRKEEEEEFDEETTDEESTDESDDSEEEEEEPIQEKRQQNIPNFRNGLLKTDIKNIENAMKEYDILKEQQNKPKQQKEISKKINEGKI
eukprot:gene5792-9613_t